MGHRHLYQSGSLHQHGGQGCESIGSMDSMLVLKHFGELVEKERWKGGITN